MDCLVAKTVPISAVIFSLAMWWKLTATSPPSGDFCEVALT